MKEKNVMWRKKRWDELTGIQKLAIALLGTLQVALLVAALWDIRRRPQDQINGSKRLWTLAAFINFIGPIAYFTWGRKSFER
jgi:hypothetical protein